MTSARRGGSLRHLGRLTGRGRLLTGTDDVLLGEVGYELDGYANRAIRTANGEVEGAAAVLDAAFQAGRVILVLADGTRCMASVERSEDGDTAPLMINGDIPFPI